MEILNIKVLKGQNYWSNFRTHLIVIELDLKEYEELPTDMLHGFSDNLTRLIPSLEDHYCSKGRQGGFLERLREGTWLGHVVEHVALELEWLAGMENRYGRTRSTSRRGVYYVIFSYELEKAGLYAAETAFKIVKTLAEGKSYHYLKEDIAYLKKIKSEEGLGVSTQAIVKEAEKRDIPRFFLEEDSAIILGQGCHQKMIISSLTSQTSSLGVDFACDKDRTKKMLRNNYIPTPKGVVISDITDLTDAIAEVGYPLVIKPLDANHGRGTTTNIHKKLKAITAYRAAEKVSSRIIVERFIEGEDYRFLVINYKLVAVAKRLPAAVMGDGESTIEELIDEVNSDPKRGEGHENMLTAISIDRDTLSLLKERGYTLETILPKGENCILKCVANISTGGTAIDVTEEVHPENIFLVERVARLMNLDVCGIDIVAKRIDAPINETNGAVIEVNASPGLRMHLLPSVGKSRNVAKNIVDMMFPLGKNFRIPIVAVTGTNGKTTTVRLIAYMASKVGYHVGFTTTDGIYINNHLIYEGDCSGPNSTKTILRDPLINFAVLECARGGILRAGLGFDKCNISILTNISEDHLGLDGIDTVEQLARVKSVVLRSTTQNGYAILNADDELVYSLRNELDCNIALFSLHANNPKVVAHCAQGGYAAYIENNQITVQHETKMVLGDITQLPLTFNGAAKMMVQNILPAVLAGVISGFPVDRIREVLENLIPSSENLPGRMNLFQLDGVQVLVDYAHNTGAFSELKEFIKNIPCNKRIGIIGIPGDRRPEDIRKIGFYCAQIFDEIIFRLDKSNRGKSDEEMTQFFKEGVNSHNPAKKMSIIKDEQEALIYALENARLGHFILHCPEEPSQAIAYLRGLQLND